MIMGSLLTLVGILEMFFAREGEKMSYKDEKWEAAENSKEERKYYFVETQSGGKYVKFYKPAIADLVGRRTRWKIREIK